MYFINPSTMINRFLFILFIAILSELAQSSVFIKFKRRYRGVGAKAQVSELYRSVKQTFKQWFNKPKQIFFWITKHSDFRLVLSLVGMFILSFAQSLFGILLIIVQSFLSGSIEIRRTARGFRSRECIEAYFASLGGLLGLKSISLAAEDLYFYQICVDQFCTNTVHRSVAQNAFAQGRQCADYSLAACYRLKGLPGQPHAVEQIWELLVGMIIRQSSWNEEQATLLRKIRAILPRPSQPLEPILDLYCYCKTDRFSSDKSQLSTQKTSPAWIEKTLGIKLTDPEPVVKAAYRKLMHQYHPDKLNLTSMSEEDKAQATLRVQDLQAAYRSWRLLRKSNQ